MCDQQEPPDGNGTRAAIASHADQADEMTPFDLSERLEKVEILIEDLGQFRQYKEELTDYIKELRTELEHIQTIRKCSIFSGAAIVLLLIGSFLCVIFFDNDIIRLFPDYALGAFVLSTVAGPIFILSVIIKGSFRTISDRNKDEMLPPHIKALLDIAENGINTK